MSDDVNETGIVDMVTIRIAGGFLALASSLDKRLANRASRIDPTSSEILYAHKFALIDAAEDLLAQVRRSREQ